MASDLLGGIYVNIMTFTTQLTSQLSDKTRDIQLKDPSSHGRLLKVKLTVLHRTSRYTRLRVFLS